MRSIKSGGRRRSPWRTLLLVLAAIAVSGAGTVALLGATKMIDLGKLAFWRPQAASIPRGWVPVPVAAREIPADTLITRNYLIDAKTGGWKIVWSPPGMVKNAILDTSKIRGRVTARDKPAYYCFTEDDFLPKGTRPGVSGGTPEGMRAITLDAGKLKGVHDLREGDHVDLLASVAIDMPGTGHSNSGLLGTNVVSTPDGMLLPKRGFVKPLVEDGVVVTPVTIRNVPTSVSSFTQGMTTRTVPVQEIVIAVAPEEVAPLAEAMDLKYEITCVARSSRPAPGAAPLPPTASPRPASAKPGDARIAATSPRSAASAPREPRRQSSDFGKRADGAGPRKADITPGLDPMADIRYTEVIIGQKRQFVLFTGPGNSPVVAAETDGSAKADAVSVQATTTAATTGATPAAAAPADAAAESGQ